MPLRIKLSQLRRRNSPVFWIFLLCFIFVSCAVSFSQNDGNETLTLTTYLPSPNAVFNQLEAKTKLVVGDITHSNTAENHIATINDVTDDQLFVENSVIFGNQTSSPASPKAGQIYFNNTSKTLEFNNGTGWQKLGP